MLKPQDILVVLKTVARGPEPWSYSQLAWELGMSASEVHAAIRRLADAGLFRADAGWGMADPEALDEFLVHGLRYVWAGVRGGWVTGTPTAWAVPPLSELVPSNGEPPPVWPDAQGPVQGVSFEPLYKSVPVAAARDARLHVLLALVDAIRGGPPAVRDLAIAGLRRELGTSRAPGQPERTPGARTRRSRAPDTRADRHGKERQRIHR